MDCIESKYYAINAFYHVIIFVSEGPALLLGRGEGGLGPIEALPYCNISDALGKYIISSGRDGARAFAVCMGATSRQRGPRSPGSQQGLPM